MYNLICRVRDDNEQVLASQFQWAVSLSKEELMEGEALESAVYGM